jgi:hypothetical protein
MKGPTVERRLISLFHLFFAEVLVMRSFALFIALILSLPVAALAGNPTVQAPPQSPTMRGLVLDSNGAIIPNAEIDLLVHIVLPIARFATNIVVSADSNEDLTAGR